MSACFMCNKERPKTLWTRTYGGYLGEIGFSVQQTSDRGYIITGFTESFGNGESDVYLIKTDKNGFTEWTRTFGDKGVDFGNSVQQTVDGGFIIVGATEQKMGKSDIYLIKTDITGNPIWIKTYGESLDDCGYSVQQTIDGGYIIAGRTQSDTTFNGNIILIKTNDNGIIKWKSILGKDIIEETISIQETSDLDLIIAATTEKHVTQRSSIYLAKTDKNGKLIWERTVEEYFRTTSSSILQTIDGGYIVVGTAGSITENSSNIYAAKLDKNGNITWAKSYGGESSDVGESVDQTYDRGYIIAGATSSFGKGNVDAFIIKIDENGNFQWQFIYGGSGFDAFFSVQETSNNEYIAVGTTSSFGVGNGMFGGNIYLIKLRTTSSR